jgi:anti-sigma-K factor RskA
MATTDDDLDALAAEYVLGTLASDERAHAEALIAIDPGFTETVRQWERRLGELNVMVEAVEPPAEVWDKIKVGIDTVTPADEVQLAPDEASEPAGESEASATSEPDAQAASDGKPQAKLGGDEAAPLLAALASTLMAEEGEAADADHAKAEPESKPAGNLAADWRLTPPPAPSASIASTAKPERGGEVVYLARRVRRWRITAAGAAAIAAVLAALIVVSQVAPGVFPAGGSFRVPQIFARAPAPAPAAPEANANRLVAVLQQDPTAPAFLLTIDPASLKLTVRRVSAAADADHSYELWLISPRFPKPRSLGVVGGSEFTQRSLASDYDLDTVRSATYKISFEPAGGSKTGAPSGPILFGGKLVETVPVPPPSQQPKT